MILRDMILVCPRCGTHWGCQYHGTIIHCGQVSVCKTIYCPNRQPQVNRKFAPEPDFCPECLETFKNRKTIDLRERRE